MSWISVTDKDANETKDHSQFRVVPDVEKAIQNYLPQRSVGNMLKAVAYHYY